MVGVWGSRWKWEASGDVWRVKGVRGGWLGWGDAGGSVDRVVKVWCGVAVGGVGKLVEV